MLTFKPRPTTKGVLLHASHTPPSQSHIEHFLRVKGRTMGLLDIGFHYVIPRTGPALPCRPHNVQGAHIRGKANREYIGVCLAGGLSEEFYVHDIGCTPTRVSEDNFTPEQGETLRSLMAYLTLLYGPLPLVGHYEIRTGRPHQCPPTDMEKVRTWLTPPPSPPTSTASS